MNNEVTNIGVYISFQVSAFSYVLWNSQKEWLNIMVWCFLGFFHSLLNPVKAGVLFIGHLGKCTKCRYYRNTQVWVSGYGNDKYTTRAFEKNFVCLGRYLTIPPGGYSAVNPVSGSPVGPEAALVNISSPIWQPREGSHGPPTQGLDAEESSNLRSSYFASRRYTLTILRRISIVLAIIHCFKWAMLYARY